MGEIRPLSNFQERYVLILAWFIILTRLCFPVHLLGIDTHDPGGYPKGVERPREPGLKCLRTARKLQEGIMVTVEPGCYFVYALSVPAMAYANTSNFFNREEVDGFKNFGGVRIESVVTLYLLNLMFIQVRHFL